MKRRKKERNYPKAMEDALNRYLTSLGADGMAPGTIKKRSNSIGHLIEFLTGEQKVTRFQSVTDRHILEYLKYNKMREYSDNYVESLMRSASLFFRFLEEKLIIFLSPAIPVPAAPVRMGLVLSKGQMKSFLEAPDKSRFSIRNKAILELMYSTAIRSGELLAMNRFDIDFDSAELTVVKGKNSKGRCLPVGRAAIEAVQRYLNEERPELAKQTTQATWLTKSGNRLSTEALLRIIKQRAKRAGLPDCVNAHTIRRTTATHMLQGGCHPMVLVKMLGHSDITSLAHYLKLTIDDLKEIHKNTKVGE